MSIERKKTRRVNVGNIAIGGDSKIAIQSMTNVPTNDYDAVYAQISSLQKNGCDIVRLTVPDMESVKSIYKLKSSDINITLVADIHFDYRIAIECANAGIDKIRINPGNIGDADRVKAVVDACRSKNIPIRIGVNSGSLEKNILAKHGSPTAAALCESAMFHASLLEKFDFNDIVISVKSSNALNMIEANRLLSEKCNYPLHLGVTEAGRGASANIKSAIGIGTLLSEGIGDTVRVSLTGDPVEEIYAARSILNALNIGDDKYYDIVSCPTCGRTKINLISICEMVEKKLNSLPKPSRKITIAVMGCVVNGPGEAAEADIGIAGGNGEAVLFKNGKMIKKIKEENVVDELVSQVLLLDV